MLGIASRAITGVAALLIGFGAGAAPGSAACTAAPMGRVAVRIVDRTPFVTASANGKPVILILDTGAQRTILTPAAAERINGETPRVEFSRQMRGIGNTTETREVELRSFSVGSVAIPTRWVRVAPITVSRPAMSVDGVLGIDTLGQFDIDFDLSHDRMLLYAGKSCDGPPSDWPRSYATIRAVGYPGAHLQISVELNGRRVTALLDTGAQRTTIAAKAAEAIGITEAMLAGGRSIMVRGAAGEQVSSHIHRFPQLKIGDLVIRDPEIVVANVNLRAADMVVGMDLLGTRRFWLSHGARQIFLLSN